MADFIVLDMAGDSDDFINKSGIQQFYANNPVKQLRKLLSKCDKARLQHLGKFAAAEYEKALTDQGQTFDFSNSKQRLYRRTSLISTLRAPMLFVQVDISNGVRKASEQEKEAYLGILI